MIVLKTIDAHVGGEPLRLIVDGFPAPRGNTMVEKQEWAARHADHLRRAAMLEPRGHADMFGAVLTEPATPGSHAGVLFMDSEGFGTLSGHGILGVATIAVERGLLHPGGDGSTIVFDTTVGTVRAMVSPGTGRASYVSVPSFVLCGGFVATMGARRVRVDIAFGGAFYAIVDAESVGLSLDAAHLPELRRAGLEIARAVDAAQTVAHPINPQIAGIDGTAFTGPSRNGSSDLRNISVFSSARVDRSACGTGLSAVMAVLDAMGLLDDQRPFTQESVIGTTLTGTVVGRTLVGDYAAILTDIEGRAWITGEHTFIVDPDDPLGEGFRL